MFEQAVLTPVGGEPVAVEAPGASLASKYVQSAQLGDEALDRPWFTHDELFDAGNVTFHMGPVANEDWGADPKAAPPSLSTHPVEAFGCPKRVVDEPDPLATQLTYVGDLRGHGSTVALAAQLTAEDSSPLVGALVSFEIAGQTLQATTGSDGIASTSASVPAHGKSQTVVVRYVGDERYLPSETTATITWGNKNA